MTVVADEKYHAVIEKFASVLKEEVNVKDIVIKSSAEGMVNIEIKPNYRKLGPKLKKDMKKVLNILVNMQPSEIVSKLKNNNLVIEGYEITDEDLYIVEKPAEDVLAVEVEGLPMIVYLDTQITPELKMEGLAREVVRRIQSMRKELNLEYDAKIKTYYHGSEEIEKAIETHKDYIMRETQSIVLEKSEAQEGFSKEWKINGKNIEITISH